MTRAAVGGISLGVVLGSCVVRWDGATLSVGDLTGPTGPDGLTAACASSPSDSWAFG